MANDEALSSPDTLHEKIMREMSQDEFTKEYLTSKESAWEAVGVTTLEGIDREVRRRGLRDHLLNQIGEVTLPHERWLNQRLREATESMRSRSTTSTSESENSEPSLEETKKELAVAWGELRETLAPLRPLWDLVSGAGTSMEDAAAAELARLAADRSGTDQPSSETSSGAPISADANYGIVAYQRLPLQGKRDAFAPGDGFLYVRNDVLKEWVRRLTAGRCCPLQRKGQPGHSSDCWLRDAVR